MSNTGKKFSLPKFIITFVLALAAILAVMIYQFWYQFAVNGDSPYDEMFIEINGMMPQSARNWACGQIADRFPGTLPPYTCQAPQ